MSRTRGNLDNDFAVSRFHRKDFTKTLSITVLAALLVGCATANGFRNAWAVKDMTEVLPEGEPFSLNCTWNLGIIWFDSGPPNPQDDSGEYSSMIEKEPRLSLVYDGTDNTELSAENGEQENWITRWRSGIEYGAQPEEISFNEVESKAYMVLKLDEEYRGVLPLFRLTHTITDGEGQYGSMRTITQKFACMRTSDLENEANP